MDESHSTTPKNGPKLDPPGAGLPWWELRVAQHIILPRACRERDWAATTRLYREEGEKILALWDALPTGRLGERVLIRRFPGIEDSSRYWSVAMTVEHLNIVGEGIHRAIASLRRGVVPEGKVRIEDVKPRGELPPEVVRQAFLRQLEAEEADEPPMVLGRGPKFPHPWFGRLDGFQWHTLLGLHQALHRHQVELIRDGLP